MQEQVASRRRFKSPYWDVPPAGYEDVTPKQYKAMQASGQVPHSVVNPSAHHLQASNKHSDPLSAAKAAIATINALLGFNGAPGALAGKPGAIKTMSPALTRQARRLYVGNTPFGCTDDELIEFFKSNLESRNLVTQPGNPVLSSQLNAEKNFAFLEFRTVEETSNAMALDGIMCKGQALKVRRPHDYQPIPGSEPGPMLTGGVVAEVPHIPGVVSSIVADSPNKIYIGGIPTSMNEDAIKEILASFGELKAFNLIKDPTTQASKGYAFCEYVDSKNTDPAIANLNGFDIADKKLIVQRASVGAKSGAITTTMSLQPNLAPVQIQVPGLPSITPTTAPKVLTEVICLRNMVEADELKDDAEYEDIREDIVQECSKYGYVRAIEIPRPRGDDENVPGLGKVFVEFDSPTEAQRAQMNLAGRRFADRVVVTSYFDRDKFRNKEF